MVGTGQLILDPNTVFSFFFFGMLKCNEMQMAIIRSKINVFQHFFEMDQFIMMSPFHLPFHLGAEGIINGARTVQTVRCSLNWTFHIHIRQTD